MPDLFFADDSSQRRPTRDGVRPLIAVGGIRVPSEEVRKLELALSALCAKSGFPDGRSGEFKWSPGRELWMHRGLVDQDRQAFFIDGITLAADHGAGVVVAVVDIEASSATSGAVSPEHDVTRLLLERVNTDASRRKRTVAVVVDRPSGSRRDEDEFLQDCLETITTGTDFVEFDNIAINVMSTPSRLVRCLQLADLITGCTTARIAGEGEFSPAIFSAIRPLLFTDTNRIGGVGLKVHPHFRYMNLYHWLVGDRFYKRYSSGASLPDPQMPYSASPDIF